MTGNDQGGELAPTATRNAVTAVVARGSEVIVGLMLTPLLLTRLGQDRYGLIVAVSSVFEYMSLLRGGIGGALRRYVTLFHHASQGEQARRYYAVGFWWAGLFRTVILALGIALALPICHFLRMPESGLPDAVLGVALIFTAAILLDAATMMNIPVYATGWTAPLSLMRTVFGWVRLLITALAFRLLVPNLRVYGGATIVVEVLTLLGIAWLAQRSGVVGNVVPRPDLGTPEIRSTLFRYGVLAVLSQAAQVFYIATDNLLIGRIYGVAAVTHYSLGARWTPLILGFLVTSVSSLTPIFTSLEARGESERGRYALLRVVKVTSALAIPFCLVPSVLGDLFLVNWVGAEYRDAAGYMIVMLTTATLEVAIAPVWMALEARGRIGWIASVDMVVAVGKIGTGLLLALGLHMGPLGFAIGNAIAVLVKNLALRPLAARRDPHFPPAHEFLRPLPRALAGGAPALILLYLLRGLYSGSLFAVILAGTVGAILCLAGSTLLAVGRAEVRSVVRALVGGSRGSASNGGRG